MLSSSCKVDVVDWIFYLESNQLLILLLQFTNESVIQWILIQMRSFG